MHSSPIDFKGINSSKDCMQRKTQYYNLYFIRLYNLFLNSFKWRNLPVGMSRRYIEISLANNGNCCFFYDDILEQFLSLPVAPSGKLDIYSLPSTYMAYSATGYTRDLNKYNSVMFYNNYARTSVIGAMSLYAYKLAEIEMTIDVNIATQKTPHIFISSDKATHSIKNLAQQVQEGRTAIFIDHGTDTVENALTVQPLNTPFLADSLSDVKRRIWGEALNYLGIVSNTEQKEERVNTMEVQASFGYTGSERNVWLSERKECCYRFNKMFGHMLAKPISVEFNEGLNELYELSSVLNKKGGNDGELYNPDL